jgi:hypothetical protein
MEAEDIEHYLSELGTELKSRGSKNPFAPPVVASVLSVLAMAL